MFVHSDLLRAMYIVLDFYIPGKHRKYLCVLMTKILTVNVYYIYVGQVEEVLVLVIIRCSQL